MLRVGHDSLCCVPKMRLPISNSTSPGALHTGGDATGTLHLTRFNTLFHPSPTKRFFDSRTLVPVLRGNRPPRSSARRAARLGDTFLRAVTAKRYTMAPFLRRMTALALLSVLLPISLSKNVAVRSNAGGLSKSTPEDRVSLLALPSLTFTTSSFTVARRDTPHAQLECVGGDAENAKERYPMRVDCYNVGLDESAPAEKPRPKWHCVSALHRSVRIENWNVHCEGWSYPDDEFILAGSCWLAYELDFEQQLPPAEQGADGASAEVEDKRRWSGVGNFFSQQMNLLLVLGAVYLFVRFGWPLIAARKRDRERTGPEAAPLVKKAPPGHASGEASGVQR